MASRRPCSAPALQHLGSILLEGLYSFVVLWQTQLLSRPMHVASLPCGMADSSKLTRI